MEYNVTADSLPDLDDWGWDDYWGCSEWIEWHKALTARYGRDNANQVFLKFWNKQSFGASTLDCRTFNSSFRDYTKSVGLYDALFDGALIVKPLGAGVDVINAASDVVSGAAQGASSVGKSLKYIVPAIIVVTIIILGVWSWSKFHKTVSK